jgi:hypothetical protein
LVQRIGNDPRPGRPGRPAAATENGQDAADAAAAPAAARPPRRQAVRWPVLAWAGGLLLVAAGLFALYLRQSLVAPFNADGASNMLQAQAMLHGNLLLKGWWSADVSFYTTELPEYMIVEAIRGLRPDVVHICGALTYTLAVLLSAMLARGRATGREGIVRALLAGGIMLAPAILGGTEIFLENPDHAGTAVPILALFLLIDRLSPPGETPSQPQPRAAGVSRLLGPRWWVPAVVCVLLAWIQVGDQLTLVAATAPIAGVAVLRLAMLAVRRRPLATCRYDALLFVAAALSNELANVAQRTIRALGGFDLRPLPQQLIAPRSQIRMHAHVMLQAIVLLFGAQNPGTSRSHLNLMADLHWIGLGLAAAGLAVAIATFFLSRTDRVTQIVAAATVATLVAGVFGTLIQSLAYAHEVAILLPLGAVLAGRMLPPLVPARWRAAHGALITAIVAPVLAAWLAANLAALCFAASWAPGPAPEQQLVSWLASRHYTDGLAEYWQGSTTTVASGGSILVAPITPVTFEVRRWESSFGWYDTTRRPNFVIAATDPSVAPGGLSVPAVRAHFGRPAHEYVVGSYVVMVYDYNLLTRVGGQVYPGSPGGD